MNQSILYWKWEKSVLDGKRYVAELHSMLKRNSFKYLYVSFHHLGVPYDDPELYSALKETCDILGKNGRSLILDIDARNEFIAFRKCGGAESYRIGFCEGGLDKRGNGTAFYFLPQCGRVGRGYRYSEPSEVLGAWCFDEKDGKVVRGTAKRAEVSVKIHDGKAEFAVMGGAENANKKFVVAASYGARLPDLFDDKIYGFYDKMFAFYGDLPLGGVANDEWGNDLILEYESDLGIFGVKMFPYSEFFEKEFDKKFGYSLRDNLLWFTRFEDGGEDKTYRVIDDYLSLTRDFMRRNNDWFYDAGKRWFGKDTFIGVHCTYWGDPYDFGVDILHNGLDWWEVRRDYAQTDEYCIMPIRLALAHKWKSPFWYNMWYSGNTQQIHTYFEESWRNVRYGGRTDYLGYECVNEPGVVKLKFDGHLEAIEQMEKRISEIDDAVSGVPNSSALIVFGMESVSNWMISYGEAKITRGKGELQKTLKFANGLFSAFNCDLVPSSEIANGSLKSENGRISYGSQTYDAVILVSPEGISRKAVGFLRSYAENGGNLAVTGTCSRFSDGSSASAEFSELKSKARFSSDTFLSSMQAVELLESWGVDPNRVQGVCVYSDGTVVFTADAVLPVGNYFAVNFAYMGRNVEFRGNDYLVLNFEKGICAYGEGSELFVDGERVTEKTLKR